MKILTKTFFQKCLFVAILAGFAVSFSVANDKYQALSKPFKNEQKSVIEVFSFWCGGCYHHHKIGTMAKIKERLPKLKYKIYPYFDAGMTYGIEYGRLYAYAQRLDDKAGLDATARTSQQHKLADAYFVALFDRKMNFKGSQEFTDFGLKVLGITQKQLNDFVQSAAGQAILEAYTNAKAVVEAYQATPAFGVGGKYYILMENIKGLDDFAGVVDELSKK